MKNLEKYVIQLRANQIWIKLKFQNICRIRCITNSYFWKVVTTFSDRHRKRGLKIQSKKKMMYVSIYCKTDELSFFLVDILEYQYFLIPPRYEEIWFTRRLRLQLFMYVSIKSKKSRKGWGRKSSNRLTNLPSTIDCRDLC